MNLNRLQTKAVRMPVNILNFDAFAIAVGKREDGITGEEGGKVVETEVEKEGIIKTGGWGNSGGGRRRGRGGERSSNLSTPE